MKRLAFRIAVTLCLLSAGRAHARINMLEPWTPGQDFNVPKFSWSHGGNMRFGFNGNDSDFFELGYFLSHKPAPNWEVGGALSYMTLDRSKGAKNDSGLTDLAFAGKYRFSKTPSWMNAAIAEAGVTLPTGDPDNGLGAGGLGLFGGASAQVPAGAVALYGQAGLRLYTEGSSTKWGNVIQLTFGGRHQLRKDLALTADLRYFDRGRDKINGIKAGSSAQEFYLAPGAQWTPKGAQCDVLGGMLLGLTKDSHDVGFIAAVKF